MPAKKKPLQPDKVEITVAPEPEIPRGMILMVAIDEQGNEIGEPFLLPERGLTTGSYTDPKRFKLKKKASA